MVKQPLTQPIVASSAAAGDLRRPVLNSFYHARSAARKWGGTADDYIQVEELIDSSKQFIGDARHRALFHNTYGVWLCQRVFGRVISVEKENGIVEVPVRLVAEQHILEDLGWLPSPNDYFKSMPLETWMSGSAFKDQALSALGLVMPLRKDMETGT